MILILSGAIPILVSFKLQNVKIYYVLAIPLTSLAQEQYFTPTGRVVQVGTQHAHTYFVSWMRLQNNPTTKKKTSPKHEATAAMRLKINQTNDTKTPLQPKHRLQIHLLIFLSYLNLPGPEYYVCILVCNSDCHQNCCIKDMQH